MLDPAPYFFLALSIFFHLGIVLPLLSGWLYSNTKVEAPPPPISVRMAAPRMAPPLPVAPPRPKRTHSVAASSPSSAKSASRSAPPPPARRQALTAPSSTRQVAAAPSTGTGNYPTYPQSGHGGGGKEDGPPGLPGGPAVPPGGNGPPGREPVMEVAHVTGLPRTIQVPTFLQKQEAPNFVITFEITVDAEGRPKVAVYQGSGCTGLDQMLTEELRQMRWEPALRDGQPISSTFRISVSGDFRKGCENFTLSQRGRPEVN
ncbi:MAG: hypothetical protein J0I12_00720 [Candidatus Eremiobacteraeota bacterium]|nr:hypothetical protein [Candidatus Eremiobacteraeota bacterium]